VLWAARPILKRLQLSATRTCAAVPAASDTFGTTTPNALFGRAATPWTRPSGRCPALPACNVSRARWSAADEPARDGFCNDVAPSLHDAPRRPGRALPL
jgi:hypothetical protein